MLIHIFLSAPQEIDEYELVDPVDILTPLEKTGFWAGVVSALSSFVLTKSKILFLLLTLFFYDFVESYQMVRTERGCSGVIEACFNKKDSSW